MVNPGPWFELLQSTPCLMVGLTGGIACGKSHSTKVFAELGAYVIDADEIAHDVIRSGQPAYEEIVAHFGRDILDPSGEIDRRRLGAIIFSDPASRQKLNSIVHPRVIEQEAYRSGEIIGRVGNCIIIVDAALMVEAHYHTRFDKLVVVHCKPELQLHRLVTRDGLSYQEAEQRISTQMPLSEKLKLANYVIETSGTYRQSRAQIAAIYALLVEALLAKAAAGG